MAVGDYMDRVAAHPGRIHSKGVRVDALLNRPRTRGQSPTTQRDVRGGLRTEDAPRRTASQTGTATGRGKRRLVCADSRR
jgi:hypothetical protein